ncbi:DUF6146 family protein [Natronoflexus pectinivorans]|uniref:Lipoprotein n=1 Tax=Natronoflexus pectinivorans TaxID=682526 RepID=A0A4R2GN55_9BACT|nr:DUF6146 family protein [Natronoflexus pectinivorans]TCO10500.1 hypothetical protein EV194_101130 [Natronoflexus pectinivorans]
MRYLIISIFVIGFLLASCGTQKNIDAPDQTVKLEKEVAVEDSIEYELIILDSRFETFLATQPSAAFHTQSYYEGWNKRYVTEWNIRHSNPLRYGDFYQTRIEYHPDRNEYGLELNYRLYYYFQFIEKEYGIRLIRRRGN